MQSQPTKNNSGVACEPCKSRLISAGEFQRLLTSHRRLERADRRPENLRGLHDLDSGEFYFTDARRLFIGIG